MYCTVLARNPDICQILDLGFRPIQVTLEHRNATTTKTPAPNKWRKIMEMIEMRRLAFVRWSCEKLKLRLAYYQILSWMGWFTGNVPASSSEMSHFFLPCVPATLRPIPCSWSNLGCVLLHIRALGLCSPDARPKYPSASSELIHDLGMNLTYPWRIKHDKPH